MKELPPVKSRKQAKLDGDKYYFSGKECSNGHIDLRHTSSYCCVSCQREWTAKERATNPIFLEKQRAICRITTNRHYHSNQEYRDKVNARAKQAWKDRYKTEKGREQAARWSKTWMAKNPEKVRMMRAAYRSKNRDKFAFIEAMRACIKRLKKVKNSNFKIAALGYSRQEFRSHIEGLFLDGMTWDNHGEWEIDHKKPVIAFIRESNFDLSQVHALENLQPLWAIDNRRKGGRH